MLWRRVAQDASRGWVKMGDSARAALSTCAAPGGGVGAWRGAVKGRIARGRRRRCVSFCGGLAGWGCDLASRCVRSAAESV